MCRNLIYTAVTIATENCAFVGETAAIERAIQNNQSGSNIRYLEQKKREIDEGRAHFAEHDLIEVEE